MIFFLSRCYFPPPTVYVYLCTYAEAAVWVMVGRFRNANVSSVAFVRNTVIRPPAPWVEPLTCTGSRSWFTLTSTGRSAGSLRGHGEMVNGVCAGLQYTETLLEGPRRGWRDGRGRKGPWSLGRASGRITERLKCFLCGWKKPKKFSQPNLPWFEGDVWQGNSSYILKTSSFSRAWSLSLLSLTCPTFFHSLELQIFYHWNIKPRFGQYYSLISPQIKNIYLNYDGKNWVYDMWTERLFVDKHCVRSIELDNLFSKSVCLQGTMTSNTFLVCCSSQIIILE